MGEQEVQSTDNNCGNGDAEFPGGAAHRNKLPATTHLNDITTVKSGGLLGSRGLCAIKTSKLSDRVSKHRLTTSRNVQ
jgi:hypothetical protein